MHRAGYVDGDLHFRNVLVGTDRTAPRFVFIDSPKGARRRIGLRRGIIHDLACLDKHAPQHFSRTDRRRFFRAWADETGLGDDRALLDAIDRRVRELHRRRNRKLQRDARREALVSEAYQSSRE